MKRHTGQSNALPIMHCLTVWYYLLFNTYDSSLITPYKSFQTVKLYMGRIKSGNEAFLTRYEFELLYYLEQDKIGRTPFHLGLKSIVHRKCRMHTRRSKYWKQSALICPDPHFQPIVYGKIGSIDWRGMTQDQWAPFDLNKIFHLKWYYHES